MGQRVKGPMRQGQEAKGPTGQGSDPRDPVLDSRGPDPFADWLGLAYHRKPSPRTNHEFVPFSSFANKVEIITSEEPIRPGLLKHVGIING